MNVIKSACDVLNLSLEQVADVFGDYWVNVYTQKLYRIYYVGCNTLKIFC
ncbi:MAG: heme NO-binding domain-containing protein [Leptospiraceae bacterium]|nr:heme NO-binding domain-containing protein [Leptospiraceae bacterium]